MRCAALLAVALAIGGAGLLAAGAWMPAKAQLAQWLLDRAWTRTDGDRRVVRPWPWADTFPVARLDLPGSGQPLTVLSGASGRNLAFAPAHVVGTALPGDTGVSVIAGHRDTHFRALRDLEIGDRLKIERPDGTRFTYSIATIDVVDADETLLRLDSQDSVVVLVTCYPFDAVTPGGSLRYVVTGTSGRSGRPRSDAARERSPRPHPARYLSMDGGRVAPRAVLPRSPSGCGRSGVCR